MTKNHKLWGGRFESSLENGLKSSVHQSVSTKN